MASFTGFRTSSLSLQQTSSVDTFTKKLQSLLCDNNAAMNRRIEQQARDMRVSYNVSLVHTIDEIRNTVKALAEAQKQTSGTPGKDRERERERIRRHEDEENRRYREERKRDRTMSPDARVPGTIDRYRPSDRERDRPSGTQGRRPSFDVGSGPTPLYKNARMLPIPYQPQVPGPMGGPWNTMKQPTLSKAAPRVSVPPTKPGNVDVNFIHPDRIMQMSSSNRSPSPEPVKAPLRLTGANADAFMAKLAAESSAGSSLRSMHPQQQQQSIGQYPTGPYPAGQYPGGQPFALAPAAAGLPPRPQIKPPGFVSGIPNMPRAERERAQSTKIKPEELERTVFNLRERAKATMGQNKKATNSAKTPSDSLASSSALPASSPTLPPSSTLFPPLPNPSPVRRPVTPRLEYPNIATVMAGLSDTATEGQQSVPPPVPEHKVFIKQENTEELDISVEHTTTISPDVQDTDITSEMQ